VKKFLNPETQFNPPSCGFPHLHLLWWFGFDNPKGSGSINPKGLFGY
jgi:hypothetical protein